MLKDLIYAILIIVVIVLAVVLSFAQLKTYTCENTWKDSGMQAEWRFTSGCMLRLPNKTLVPAKSWRTM